MAFPGLFLNHASCAPNKYILKGPNTDKSYGFSLWMQRGGKGNMTIPFSFAEFSVSKCKGEE